METRHDVNGSIALARTTVKLVDGLTCSAQVVLRLSPVPRIRFELLDPSPEFQAALFDATLENESIAIELPSGENVQVLDDGRGLVPKREPVTGRDMGKLLYAVRFGVINLPDFMKPRSTESQTDSETPWRIEDLWTINLKGDPWLVEIRPVDNRGEVHKSLRRKRGFALTHWGRVTLENGKPFSKECVERFLETLRGFLSFCRGVACGMTLITGLDRAGETVWEKWGVTRVKPWEGHRSCLDVRSGASLEDLFVGFWRYAQECPSGSKTHLALEWYLESNAQDATHTSIVLTQAALERLTDQTVGSRAKGENEGDWMARALRKTQVCPTVPMSLAELGSLTESETFEHGPHALVAIRNDLVHTEMKMRILPNGAYMQARELGLWYTELLLLDQFGHNGLYSNRLTREWVGEVETVPWAK